MQKEALSRAAALMSLAALGVVALWLSLLRATPAALLPLMRQAVDRTSGGAILPLAISICRLHINSVQHSGSQR